MEYGRSLTGMSTGSFYRCLRSLNSKLRVCSLEGSNHAAGLYFVDPKEGWTNVCGVDKEWVPVTTTVDGVGHILKSGWVRVVRILLARGLTTRAKVQKVWPNFFLSRIPATEFSNADPIFQKIQQYETDEMNKRGVSGLTADQALEIAEDIHKNDTEAKKVQDDQHKWELKKALDQDQKIYI